MSNRIEQALAKRFDKHRIVFWHDADNELRGDFDAVDLDGVEKIELANNEFSVKHRILRKEPDTRFLLYRAGPQPDDLGNWLLDVQLAHDEFRTDQAGIWLADLELGLEFAELVREHEAFFRANERLAALKDMLDADDLARQIRLKMLSVCAGAEPRLDTVVESLLQELANGTDKKIELIRRCGLAGYLWASLTRIYGYESPQPGIKDFLIELFKSCYALHLDGRGKLNNEALVFLRRWKDSRQHETTFEALSAECAEVMGLEADLGKRDLRDLIEIDYFELIDRKILSDMVTAVVDKTVSHGDLTLWIRQRRLKRWYRNYANLYEAVEQASGFIQLLQEATLEMESLADGVRRYAGSWYQLDQRYRKFVYHVCQSGQISLLGPLQSQIESLYSNSYLLKLNNRWQAHVDNTAEWSIPELPSQQRFFERCVRPFLNKGFRACVIISDALRYEIGEELLNVIRREDRYNAEIEAAVSMLPSYTQLGMAALLPHTELAIADNETASVTVDGKSSQGTASRKKILKAATEGAADAIKSEDFLNMSGVECRDLLKANDVLYIYHNRIDHTGDKMHSEGQAFDAAEQTLTDLLRLVKKLSSANASNILITADHGFIYQHDKIDESDFLAEEPAGKDIRYRDRRFVLGKGLKDKAGLRYFTSNALGLTGDMEVQLPKSINRLRLKGSGSRFVHGGASLQEVVIPVLRVNKKRQSDVSQVEVEIISGSSSVITSGQHAVVLYQSEPVSDKVQGRLLRAGIYTEEGELISDSHELIFDLATDNPRERELPLRFVLSRDADKANNKDVMLKLEERHSGTTHYKEYKSVRYRIQRQFGSDFDF